MTNLQHDLWQLDAYTVAIGKDVDGRLQVRQLAGVGARLSAGLIDMLIQAISGAALYFAMSYLSPQLFADQKPYILGAAMVEWHIIYFLLFEAFSRGSTPGKAICGISVASQTDTARPTPLQTLGRNLVRAVDLLPVAYLAGLLTLALTLKRQRLGDMIAGTVVVYSRNLADQLAEARVPDSIFGSSEDGYLLEAFLVRAPYLRDETRYLLATDLARYLVTRYAGDEPDVRAAYEAGRYQEALNLLYQLERSNNS